MLQELLMYHLRFDSFQRWLQMYDLQLNHYHLMCTNSGLEAASRLNLIFARRAWKSVQLEQN